MKYKKNAFCLSDQLTIGVTPVYSPDNPYQAQLRKQLEQRGVKVHDFKFKTLLLKRMIRRYKIDILHLHWLSPFIVRKTYLSSCMRGLVFISKLCLIKLAGIKIVWTVHNLRDHEEPFPLLSKIIRYFIIKLASGIIVHSEIARKSVCGDFGKSINKKLSVVPHGHFIDCYPNDMSKADSRKELGISPDRFVYLFFGAVREYKGVDKLISAFDKINNPEVTLIIAGKAIDQEINRQISKLCEGRDNIVFISTFVKPEDVQLYMNACNVVVFPYRKILTSGAVILAMSFGRACIAPRIGCIPDVLDEDGAFLYEGSDNQQQLLKAMQDAFETSDSAKQMGLHNRKLAERWQWDEIAEATHEIYRQILGQ